MSAPSPCSMLRSLTGKTWQNWTYPEDEEVGFVSLSTSPIPSGSTSPSHSPQPPSSSTSEEFKQHEDVMKLPKKDMHIFGLCPVSDEFTLVQCSNCSQYVKIEAFERHFRQRHDRDRKPPVTFASLVASINSSSFASSSHKPRSSESSSKFAPKIKEESNITTPSLVPSRLDPPMNVCNVKTEIPDESMSEDLKLPEDISSQIDEMIGASLSSAPRLSMEEADSTTNNVISIPDTDQLPHSLSNDLMAMVESGGMDPIKEEMDSSNQSAGVSMSSIPGMVSNNSNSSGGMQISPSVIKLQGTPNPTPPSTPHQKVSPGKEKRKPQREYHPDKHCGVWDNDGKRHCTRALTCKSHSVLLKRKIPGRSKSFDELVAEHKAVKEAQAAQAAATAAQVRVIQPPNSSSSSSLVSQSISLLQPQPPLTATSIGETVLGQLPIDPNTIDPSRFQSQIIGGIRPNVTLSGTKVPNQTASPPTSSWALDKRGMIGRETDENLHYTTDHPKPLAVCTFGARRVGGILVADRSQYLTRKIVRVAISAGGYHRIRPTNRINELKFHSSGQLKQPRTLIQAVPPQRIIQQQQQQQQQQHLQLQLQQQSSPNSYQVSYTLSPAANSPARASLAGVKRTVSGTPIIQTFGQTNLSGPGTVPRIVNLANLPSGAALTATTSGPLGITAPVQSEGSLKTDVQDFKGGIKFELGRKIKHILPSGGEISK
ncbi:ataxin-7-like protein 1 [Tigriopus californicus]|uniref:ataxin-7-like protein 1 n=1 Tax=Tigriopus californicus TaxID=6832 RepID=UPI0027D9EC7E|nr:ataxin-7-like protein 1 [Tigriopus californicus]XP_059092254.1 ataxin-7-like protein 1 [Tigriopus californicus]XP_059092255.1 ataxin-7-like protein 1 [Tigriopus californicus]XP_059092256.1 ataxin-7-like protein 1 [Tigriopus californicus]XP_059092258.1 ataxin-7-like protein 1 [Tigriopus californicus]